SLARNACPPKSPRFPYTTLFRSHLPTADPWRSYGNGEPSARTRRGAAARLTLFCGHVTALDAPPAEGNPHEPRPSRTQPTHIPRDRKSTRLNSSHVSISYAVFCL